MNSKIENTTKGKTTMNDIMLNILYAVISTALAIGGAFAVRYIRTKTNWQFKNEIADAVITATAYVQQTYVDNLKEDRIFFAEEQAEARNRVIDIVLDSISLSAKNYLYHNRGLTDVRDYITHFIEESVRNMKKGG